MERRLQILGGGQAGLWSFRWRVQHLEMDRWV